MPRIAVIALLVVALCACDAPWEGPTLPVGAHWIDARAIASGPQKCALGQELIAGTTVDQVGARVLAACAGRGCNATVGCWPGLIPPQDSIFVAVHEDNGLCGAAGKGGWAVSPSTLYLISWVGRATGRCGEAGMASFLVLYAVARSVLPKVQLLTVELQVQDVVNGTSTYDAQVSLG